MMMSNEPTADDLARALTGLMDAHREHDKQYDAFDGCSWDYHGGEYIDAVTKAHEHLATTLNEYIDARVRTVLLENVRER